MECNKGEAIRAMSIAERKMQSKDFVGARKMAHMAQKLFPELENISHMLSVCDVHCAADVKAGPEMDWYGILQVGITADDVTIKKQYRRLALLLHPDKNKFCGAEAAFKIIGEAQRNLLDRCKRLEHNVKRNMARNGVPAKRQHQPLNGTRQSYNKNLPHNSDATSQHYDVLNTFWTRCPFCGTKYQYFKTVMNKAIRCQNCMKPFIASDLCDLSGPGVRPASMEEVSGHKRNSSKEDLQTRVGTATSHENPSREPPEEVVAGAENKLRANGTEDKVGKGKAKSSSVVNPVDQPLTVGGKKRGRKEREKPPSEGNDKVDATMEFDSPSHQSKEAVSQECFPRSERKKQHVDYKEHGSDRDDDDDLKNFSSPKRSKVCTHINEAASCEEGVRADQEAKLFKDGVPSGRPDENTSWTSSGQPKSSSSEERPRMDDKSEGYIKERLKSDIIDDESVVTYTQPEFYDFDQDRTENSFKANQIWALYDDREGLPRFYAKIKRVISSSFKVHFTWLETLHPFQDSVNRNEVPCACGTFKVEGDSFSSETVTMFSYLASWEKGLTKNTYNLYPRKGDVWAVFKNWDIGWTFDVNKYKNCEFEIVEILSDYSKENGVEISYLRKVKGFVSLFQRLTDQGTDIHQIGPEELQSFSHKIPSHRLLGTEREGIPERSIELDPAAVPTGLEEFEPLNDLNFGNKINDSLHHNAHIKPLKSQENFSNGVDNIKKGKQTVCQYPEIVNGSSDKRATFSDENPREADHLEFGENSLEGERAGPNLVSQIAPFPSSYELPGSEFHNFETAISVDDFQPGQFWSLYSDEDGLPKYYAKIEDVEIDGFSVTVRWFELFPTFEEERRWSKEGLPAGCGTFRLSGTDTYNTIGAFSHQIRAIPTPRHRFILNPQKGEMWVLYKNWKLGWTLSDMVNCEYLLVEIRHASQFGFRVVALEKVGGYRYVFKAVGTEKDIPPDETLRFSHRVPAFHLTEERGGKLRGYFELDPAALPEALLCSQPS